MRPSIIDFDLVKRRDAPEGAGPFLEESIGFFLHGASGESDECCQYAVGNTGHEKLSRFGATDAIL